MFTNSKWFKMVSNIENYHIWNSEVAQPGQVKAALAL